MKLHITQKQWDEYIKAEKKSADYWATWLGARALRVVRHNNMDGAYSGPPNIGQMIEFLGENMYQINLGTNGLAWAMLTKEGKQITAYELCDALWEAVKHKLNHPQEDE